MLAQGGSSISSPYEAQLSQVFLGPTWRPHMGSCIREKVVPRCGFVRRHLRQAYPTCIY